MACLCGARDLDCDSGEVMYQGGEVAHCGPAGPADSPPPIEIDDDGDGYTLGDGDCDDADTALNPGAPEVCNGIDDNCDGEIDEGVTDLRFRDEDGDGFGAGDGESVCGEIGGYVAEGGDCDDYDVTANPAAMEVCNAVDDDCDGTIDEGCGDSG